MKHLSEFDIIENFFMHHQKQRDDVVVGIGDDGAVVKVPHDKELVIAVDTLVEGVHFIKNVLPENLGYKALAVNLSDLAAMGALPRWTTLSLTLPYVEADWLTAFSDGFFSLCKQYDMQLIGGDITQGPLTVSVQVHGFVNAGCAVRRQGANPGDLIYVTSTLGDAGLALQCLNRKIELSKEAQTHVLQRLHRPTPRVNEALKIAKFLSAAIDVSDGLAADLKHILDVSHVGATLFVDRLPLSDALRQQLSLEDAWQLALGAGDDYELCFTVPKKHRVQLEACMQDFSCACTCIGEITSNSELGLRCQKNDGSLLDVTHTGYQHFSEHL